MTSINRKASTRQISPSHPLKNVTDLSPASFGVVMATGIVSLAAHLLAMPVIADILFRLNIIIYGVLWLLTMVRLVCYPRCFFSDLFDHSSGPGFFTMVAGSGILGSQFVVLSGNIPMGLAMWFVTIGLWFGTTYTIFTAVTIKREKPLLGRGLNGGWLLAVVAAESVAVLSALLAKHVGQSYELELNFLAFLMWLWGSMLYIWIISLIFYRYTFLLFSPKDFSPSYWINMGAMAISTLGGSLLISNATTNAPFLYSLLPFIKGFTLFYWATSTWWIPLLLILSVWRYACMGLSLNYDPLHWGIVFPLGMYAASSHEMAAVMALEFLRFLPPLFLYAALLVWAAVLVSWIVTLLCRAGICASKY
ncbi:tellurite resistance/C4-dicarboxylate transporter family protein [Nitrosococcus watsonii]|uniref:C4-dicarboxylate transporter/malic acid transport protein n=1 Tax=Nitrosococcus watsoni (strain C-113) TaxID=105559 RepID=D8K851_NITWC|nr:tellurite resistance/C4-dicarboxylate transporter family protein [Nitrosococcus watsonii]ADJ27046.1 C4-dicarboxylate transporter/malic acid transport protein [Nitrosococcus watsonii C-113]